jgi:hypothetical protein
MSPLVEVVITAYLLVLIVLVAVFLRLSRRAAELLEAKTMNEKLFYVHETGEEAYSYAESMQPDSNKAERLEYAIEYMRRQCQERRFPFDYEQARAVIEKAAWRRGGCRSLQE